MRKGRLIIVCIFILLLLSITGCSVFKTKKESISKINTPALQKSNQTIKSSGNKATNKPTWDVVFERIYQSTEKYKIDVLIPKVIGSGLKQDIREKINSVLKRYIDQQIENIKRVAEGPKNELDFYPYILNIKCEWDKSVSPYISFLFEEYSYTGGAHGLVEVKGFNFNVETGNEMKPKDLLNSEQRKLIPNYIYFARALCKDLDDPPYEVFWGQNKQETPAEDILDNAIFKNGGIMVYFEPYEIASFARGIVKFWFSFDELNGKKVETDVDLKDCNTIKELLDANLGEIRKKFGLPTNVYSYEGGLQYSTKSGLALSFLLNSVDCLENMNDANVYAILAGNTIKLFGIPLRDSFSEVVQKLKNIREIKKINEGIDEESGCYLASCELDENIKVYIEAKNENKSSDVSWILIKRESYGYGQIN